MIRYFAVKTKCGHVGKAYYIPIDFAIRANDAKEAAEFARHIKRAKHDHKDCVLGVKEINYQQYLELREKNSKDPYLNCKNKQEQNMLDLSDRLVPDPHYKKEVERKGKCQNQNRTYYKKEEIRNPHKYYKMNNHNDEDYDDYDDLRWH
jgi:hypothetical protein